MVYIHNNVEITQFPKESHKTVTKLVFENQITKDKTIMYEPFVGNYTYVYKVDLSSIMDWFEIGQYDYYFYNEDEIISSGILQFGNYQNQIHEYESDKNTIIQYN